jgi:ribosome maturation protein SDO1
MTKGNKLIDDHIQISVNLLRYKSHGKTFEIAIEPDKAVEYKEGEKIAIDEIIHAQQIFEDMKKGFVAPKDSLLEVFNTTDTVKIVETMLEHGEIQFTQKYRTELRERKFNKLVNIIHINAINPKTNVPHPENRIRSALDEAKFKLNDFKKAADQVDDAIKLLHPIIPIRIEKTILKIHIPLQYSAKLYNQLTTKGKMITTNWLSDGSVNLELEIPAGLQQDIINILNNASHGSCIIEQIEHKKK